MPRYSTSGGLRLEITPSEPIFVYGVYAGDDEVATIEHLVDLWPEDLLGYLVVQLIYPSHEKMSDDEGVTVLERVATVTDRLQIPLMVQTAAFLGPTGPDDEQMTEAFVAHPSLVGVAIAELSALPETAVSGLTGEHRDLVADQIQLAADNDALFLWADMGYLGPQVFVDAGADERLAGLMKQHADHVVF